VKANKIVKVQQVEEVTVTLEMTGEEAQEMYEWAVWSRVYEEPDDFTHKIWGALHEKGFRV
jgi:hypothetical protein